MKLSPEMGESMRVLDDWLLTAERVALHLPSHTAVVADLHLGYDEARRRSGEAVPVRPLDELLRPLADVLSRNRSKRLIIAGDLLEDGRCRAVLADCRRWLEKNGMELAALTPGNHDRGLEAAPSSELSLASSIRLADWTVIHGDEDRPDGRVVQGHEHPWFRYSGRLGTPCYLFTGNHLVLPAYSPDAAGVNVLGVRRWRDYRCGVIAGDRVLDFGPVGGLRRDVLKTALRGRG
jgi:putative SbcD/Mre11-related phosphoesterase